MASAGEADYFAADAPQQMKQWSTEFSRMASDQSLVHTPGELTEANQLLVDAHSTFSRGFDTFSKGLASLDDPMVGRASDDILEGRELLGRLRALVTSTC